MGRERWRLRCGSVGNLGASTLAGGQRGGVRWECHAAVVSPACTLTGPKVALRAALPISIGARMRPAAPPAMPPRLVAAAASAAMLASMLLGAACAQVRAASGETCMARGEP